MYTETKITNYSINNGAVFKNIYNRSIFILERNTKIELNKTRDSNGFGERGERVSNISCWRIVNTKTKRDGIVDDFTFVEQIVRYWPANHIQHESCWIPNGLIFAPLIHITCVCNKNTHHDFRICASRLYYMHIYICVKTNREMYHK